MGCCHHTSISSPNTDSPAPDPKDSAGNLKIPPPSTTEKKQAPILKVSSSKKDTQQRKTELSPIQIQEMTKNILQNFEVAKYMKEKIEGVAHTSGQVKQFAQYLLSAIQDIQKIDSEEEKQLIENIFQKASQMHQKGELFYHNVIQILKKKIKGNEIKTESLSRIYHYIANFNKQKLVNEKVKNQFGIQCWKTNGYKKLSSQQIEQLIHLQTIGAKIEQLGVKMKMKFDYMITQSENINRVLSQCLLKYENQIQNLKYDLHIEEVMKVGSISRESCNYHDNGVVLLLIYLVRSCAKLQKEGNKAPQIQKMMQAAVKNIFEKYPPGQGLTQEQKYLQDTLKKLNEKGQFSHQPSKFDSDKNKQSQLEDIILSYARIAKRNKNDFEELLRQTCLNLAIQIKVGLKINPDKPNIKAMIRIKEKSLFGKTQVIQRQTKETIAETLSSEDDFYKNKIDKLLSEKEQIIFKISDMVRGKCVFLDVNDIILTIDQIKSFVKNDQRKRFRITEIESRFTNPVPISDVTLKIALNQEIVAELQLTVQANAATYNFSHKVYELQRTKAFSKLKIVHNYFDEFAGDFKELVSTALQISAKQTNKMTTEQKEKITESLAEATKKEKLSDYQRSILISQKGKIISQFFDVSQFKVNNIEEAIEQTLNNYKTWFSELKTSTNIKFQGIMLPLFKMEMGSWLQELGSQVNNVIESVEYSDMLKATLMYFFFNKFDLSKQLKRMIQFFGTYHSIAERQKLSWARGKDYMEIFFRQAFMISKPFAYAQHTARSYFKTLQFKQVCLQRAHLKAPCKLVINFFINDLVTSQKSPQNVKKIMEYLLSFFQAIQESPEMVQSFKIYYQWIIYLLNNNQKLNTGLLKYKAQLLNIQIKLQNKQLQTVENTLIEMIKTFKQKQQNQKWLECQLFLAEVKANQTNDIKQFNKYYRKQVEDKASAVGLELRGKEVANSQWRIYNTLWKKELKQDEKTIVEGIHLRKALTESSRSEGNRFVDKMVAAKSNDLDVFNLCTVIPNHSLRFVSFNTQTKSVDRCEIISKATQWPNLQNFNMDVCSIQAEGCRYLCSVDWPNLTSLRLGSNSIGPQGCKYLSQVTWKNLVNLYLQSNKVGSEGCKYLSKAQWHHLKVLNLFNNKIDNESCLHLSTAHFPSLTELNLKENTVEAQGCRHLAGAKWPNLVTLILQNNNAGDEGCRYLSQANWPNLAVLDLWRNSVGAEGCAHLSAANWPKLTKLDLYGCNAGPEGCRHLSSANWTHLEELNLNANNIGAEGCLHLSAANWPKLTTLNLFANLIKSEGCGHLNNANWSQLKVMNLGNNKIDNDNHWRMEFAKKWPKASISIFL